MFFLKMYALGHCTGITYVDSTMIPECNNIQSYAHKVFKGIAINGKGTMGCCYGFKLHFTCNPTREMISFCLTGGYVDDKSDIIGNALAKDLYGKLFADRGCLSQNLFNILFADNVNWVTRLRWNMKNKLMSLWGKIILRKKIYH